MSQTPAASKSLFNRNNPFSAVLLENRLLSKPGSEKDTRHLVLKIDTEALPYNPGDSLGVLAQNPQTLVLEMLKLLELNPETSISVAPDKTLSLEEALKSVYVLNRSGKKLVKACWEKLTDSAAKEKFQALVADEAKLDEYVFTRDCFDVISDFPSVRFTAEELIGLLNKSNPRLYSIASSPKKHPNEVHLTVAVVRYETHGRPKVGLASGYLAEGVALGEEISVYVQPTRHFHLPSDPNTAMIMVGPGTGIAPFRAFLEHRQVHGHQGKNWLFFGDQKAATDFLYGEEFAEYQKQGLLTRLDTAFSRDQAHKIYVQNRMLENGKELWQWLQEGAYFYVCGDAKRMARDVHQALIDIAQKEGGLSADAAKEYIEVTLTKTEKRYLKDVY
ncbi:MAG: sulfite reductase subunit alpha [Verrucomicrobiae bacterium]|nr:sulfite reductase subunit alpha [Verrucomicrobiae bacterium]